MRHSLVTAAALAVVGGLVAAACDDGTAEQADSGSSATSTSGSGGGSTSGSSSSSGGSGSSLSGSTSGNGEGSGGGSTTGSSNSGSSGGSASGGTGGPTSGSGVSSGASADASASGSAGSGSTGGTDPYSGPFKVLVLSKTLGYHHDSIPACQQMLRELGRCVDAASCATTNDTVIAGAKPNSSFTVDVAGAPSGCPELMSTSKPPLTTTTPSNDPNYLAYVKMGCDGAGVNNDDPISHFNTTNLDVNQFSSPTSAPGPYQFIFFCSPTGTDFTSDGATGMAGETAIQNFIQAGAGYGGVHAASDFEDTEMWQWYYNDLMGSWFKDHNNDGTPGTIITVPMYATHPIMNGIPSPWNTEDEWYWQNREMSSVAGFQILATLSGVPALAGEAANDIRPVIWIKQFTTTTAPFEGRMFYTIRGHNIARYGEAPFRQLIHQGILWAANRLN